MTVTPEAAGSSPVDPANYLQHNYLHCSMESRPADARGRRSFRADASLANCTKFRESFSEVPASASLLPPRICPILAQLATFSTFAPSARSQVSSHKALLRTNPTRTLARR